MEKREPSFVPEWLGSSGNGSGAGNKNQNSDSSLTHDSKSTNPRTNTDVDSVRSHILDRKNSSTDAPRRFSNGSTRNAYRNFNGQRRGKDRRMEKDSRSNIDPWDRDSRFPSGTILNGRNQQPFRRSNSTMTTRKHEDHLGQRFSKDFPQLKTEEREEGGMTDLSLAVKSLSVGDDSGMNAGEGCTAAPAEIPNVTEKSGSYSVVTSNTHNMAEAFSQPPRTGTLPQGYSMIKRLDQDRALKLIPLVPSTPKGSVSKTKPMVRSGAIGLSSFRNTHKPDSAKKLVVLKPAVKESGDPRPINNSQSAGFQMIAAPSVPFATSVARTKSRNAFYSALKKKTSTIISTSSSIFPSVEENSDISKELVASNSSSVQAAERDDGFEPADLPDEKEAEFLKSLGWDENNTDVDPLTDEEIRAFYEQHKEVKPSLMRTLPIIKEATKDSTGSCFFSPIEEKADISKELVASDPSSVDIVMERVEKVSEAAERVSVFESSDLPDEKEAEFLKSLGWDENNTDVDPLIDEEIRAFYVQHKEVKPSLM